ncbi:MAG: C-GCAxxG-C-C family protein [Oscillospiraceae bacterium]|nr:C-GCAxxG-C-C family protein [Oscillospiraceae bacterium]
MSERKEKAIKLFEQKYNCAQAVVLAYGDSFDLDEDALKKVTSGFGGGIAATGEVCGAISGAVVALGLKYGFTDSLDTETRAKQKEVIRNFMNAFKANHKGVDCRELLTEDEGTVHKIHSPKCFSVVEEICDLLEKYL